MPSLIAAGIAAAGSVASGVIGANAAQGAANTQASAANNASNNTLNMFDQTKASLAPFVSAGTSELGTLQSKLPSLSAPFAPTLAQLAQTPGYQFALNQGSLGAQNGMAASGLGKSGAAQKSLANYAEGLAGNTEAQQAGLYYQGQNQAYNMLSGLVNTGENAGAMTGQQGLTASGQAGNFSTAGAAASAAGQVGSANAIGGALNGLGSTAQTYALFSALNGQNALAPAA